MRTLGAAWITYLSGHAVALCRLVTITRKSGTIIRFTDAQSDLTRASNTYTKARGIRLSSLPYELNATRNSLDFEIVAVDDGTIDPDDLRNGLYDSADVRIALASLTDDTLAPVPLWRGQIGEISITDRGLATVEVLGLLSKAREIPVEHYTPTCRTDFGDARCGVDLGPLTVSTTITAVSGFDVTVAASPASHFRLGLLSPTTGNGVGEGFEIRDVTGSVLKMYLTPGGKLQVGDAVDLTPGCDKTRDGPQGCKFWDNIVNMRAEPDVPGADALNITYQDWGA